MKKAIAMPENTRIVIQRRHVPVTLIQKVRYVLKGCSWRDLPASSGAKICHAISCREAQLL